MRQGSEWGSPPATHILKGWPKTAEFFQTIGDGWVAWPSPLEDRNPSGPVPLTVFSFPRIVSDSKVSWGSELGFAKHRQIPSSGPINQLWHSGRMILGMRVPPPSQGCQCSAPPSVYMRWEAVASPYSWVAHAMPGPTSGRFKS